MFLKVKHVAGKQYFAICESVRRDKKIVTTTIKSLGNSDKALKILESEYPVFLDRFHEIVGTKKCRDNILYGLYLINDYDFRRIGYSGLNYGLLDKYKNYDAAEKERKTLVAPEKFIVKEIPENLILADKLKLNARLDAI